jgi:hypothetical protein
MKAMCYRDWQTAGFQVIRGEKSTCTDRQGRPTFRRDQVEPSRGFDRPKAGERVYNPEFEPKDEDR